MKKKNIYLIIFGFFFAFAINGSNSKLKIDSSLFFEKVDQDNKIMIRKLKARLAVLEKQRSRFKSKKKWSEAQENNYQSKIHQLNINLARMSSTPIKKLSIDQEIDKLKLRLVLLNKEKSNRTDENPWTKKDDDDLEKKKYIITDSIIKLKQRKN